MVKPRNHIVLAMLRSNKSKQVHKTQSNRKKNKDSKKLEN